MSVHPLLGFNKEEIVYYAKALIGNAEAKLEVDDVEGAVWRLADALGALSFCAQPGTQGLDTFTGLGFKLAKADKEPNDNT